MHTQMLRDFSGSSFFSSQAERSERRTWGAHKGLWLSLRRGGWARCSPLSSLADRRAVRRREHQPDGAHVVGIEEGAQAEREAHALARALHDGEGDLRLQQRGEHRRRMLVGEVPGTRSVAALAIRTTLHSSCTYV